MKGHEKKRNKKLQTYNETPDTNSLKNIENRLKI